MASQVFKKINSATECLEILQHFKKELESLRKSSHEELVKFSTKFIEQGNILTVFEKKNEYKGFISYYSNDNIKHIAYISMIAVATTFQNQHIGSALLEKCIEDCQSKKMRTIKLEVSKQNTQAQSFYKRKGFKYSQNETEKSFFMEKEI